MSDQNNLSSGEKSEVKNDSSSSLPSNNLILDFTKLSPELQSAFDAAMLGAAQQFFKTHLTVEKPEPKIDYMQPTQPEPTKAYPVMVASDVYLPHHGIPERQ